MAKKKTAPVLRIENPGVEPTPDPEERTITKSYAVRDDWKDRDITNFVFFKSVDGEITDLLVNGEPAGGGGDPETVNIKIKNTSSHDVLVSTMIDYSGLTASRKVNHNSNETLKIVMYEPEMPFTFTTMDGGSIISSSTFGTVTFDTSYRGTISQGDTINITNA